MSEERHNLLLNLKKLCMILGVLCTSSFRSIKIQRVVNTSSMSNDSCVVTIIHSYAGFEAKTKIKWKALGGRSQDGGARSPDPRPAVGQSWLSLFLLIPVWVRGPTNPSKPNLLPTTRQSSQLTVPATRVHKHFSLCSKSGRFKNTHRVSWPRNLQSCACFAKIPVKEKTLLWISFVTAT